MQVLEAIGGKVLSVPVLTLIIGLISLAIAHAMGLFTKRLDVKGKVRDGFAGVVSTSLMLAISACTSPELRPDWDECLPQRWSSVARMSQALRVISNA